MKSDMTVTRAPHILLVDDDSEISGMLSKFLREHGLSVTVAGNGALMMAALQRQVFDLILLDIMMPGEDGLSLCRRLQMQGDAPPIILVTAVGGEMDRVLGLEIGADDYVTKPFSPRELLARVRTVLRRTGIGAESRDRSAIYTFAGWTIDISRRTLTSPDNTLVMLTSTEFDLLALFVENPQRALTRDQLLDALHGRATHLFDRAIDVQISRLRRKIEPSPQTPSLIKTLRNEGYFFAPSVTRKEGLS